MPWVVIKHETKYNSEKFSHEVENLPLDALLGVPLKLACEYYY